MNNKSITYKLDLEEIFLLKIGSTLVIDSIYLYLVTILAALASILNALSFYIFTIGKFQNKAIFTYLKYYSVNSLIISLLSLFSFYTYSPRYFSFALSFMARLYRCKFISFFAIFLIFDGYFIDILILISCIKCTNSKEKMYASRIVKRLLPL